LSDIKNRLPRKVPRCQAPLEDELCPVKWRSTFFFWQDAYNSSILALFFCRMPTYMAEALCYLAEDETALEAASSRQMEHSARI